jgi:hypothetical protein
VKFSDKKFDENTKIEIKIADFGHSRNQNTGPLLRLLNDPIRKYDANQAKITKFFFKTEQ